MRWTGWLTGLLLAMTLGCANEGPESFSLARNIRSPEGWQGQRYFENGLVLSEKFDAIGNDGRIDLWRFYEKGHLLLEERDRDGDGRVDYAADYQANKDELRKIVRDTNFDGRDDLWIAYGRGSKWQQRRDINHDGYVDFEFTFKGPSSLLSALKVDYQEVLDLREVIPTKHWHLLALDQNRDGLLDTWERYSAGRPIERGVDLNRNGRPDKWVRLTVNLDAKKPGPAIGKDGLTRSSGSVISAAPTATPKRESRWFRSRLPKKNSTAKTRDKPVAASSPRNATANHASNPRRTREPENQNPPKKVIQFKHPSGTLGE